MRPGAGAGFEKGLRFTYAPAALRFIPKEKLEAEGYGKFAGMFEARAGR